MSSKLNSAAYYDTNVNIEEISQTILFLFLLVLALLAGSEF